MPMRRAFKRSLFGLAILAGATPALAGDGWGSLWRGPTTDVPWYDQAPLAGTGPGFYYSQHPDHVPGYPKRLTGVAVPVFDTGRPVVSLQPVTAHEDWCAARYRSYDVRTDTYQPHHGPRRYCRSAYR